MSKNFFMFFLFIILSSFMIVLSENQEKKKSTNSTNDKQSNNDRNNQDDTFIYNPYVYFQVPQWTKFEDVQKRFSRIKEKIISQNKTNTKEYKALKQAYEMIEREYIQSGYKDKTFFQVLIYTFKNIFYYEIMMIALLVITYLIYQFSAFTVFLIFIFTIIDNLIPHWFGNMTTQYIVSFLLGTIIYCNKYWRQFFCPKTENDDDKNENTNNGRVKRRRFEKYE